MPKPEYQRDEFAELYVAGLFADAGWTIYFPRKDIGFDFIVSKKLTTSIMIRPVQVKGKYAVSLTSTRKAYGYLGDLTALHDTMVLAIPYFKPLPKGVTSTASPECVAFMPRNSIKTKIRKGLTVYSCTPAQLLPRQGMSIVVPKRTYLPYFDAEGLAAMELPGW